MAFTNSGNSYTSSVFHNATEESSLLYSSPSLGLDGDSIKLILGQQKRVYSAITLADVFQKIVYTTILTSFLVFASSYLGYQDLQLLQIYFIFTITLWVSTAFLNGFVNKLINLKNTILLGFFIYLIGVIFLTGYSSNILKFKLSKSLIIIPLCLICVGEGLCKAFIGDFGRNQFQGARLSERLKTYTDILFWISNTCAVLLILLLLGICELGNFELGFGLCCVCLAAGLFSFSTGWKGFLDSPERNSTGLAVICKIICNARGTEKVAKNNENGHSLSKVHHWLDYAKLENGGLFPQEEVEEGKSFIKMFIVFLSLIPYWVCNAQGYSTFIFQGFHLNANIGDKVVPVSWTALLNIAAALLYLKISERFVYPALRRSGYTFPMSWRVITGMVIALMSMCSAGVVQLYAHNTYNNNNSTSHRIGKINVTYVNEMHILWTTPQYVFLGISEVLVGLTAFQLGCKLCPNIFKKLMTSTYYLVIALGHVISLLILSLGWFPSGEFLEGYVMVLYFFSLGCFSILGIVVYVCAISERHLMRHNVITIND